MNIIACLAIHLYRFCGVDVFFDHPYAPSAYMLQK